jgi:hypothetical protein
MLLGKKYRISKEIVRNGEFHGIDQGIEKSLGIPKEIFYISI